MSVLAIALLAFVIMNHKKISSNAEILKVDTS